MESPFKKIGLAITFSPTGKSLLMEAKRLKNLFNAQLVLFHAGKKNPDTENLLSSVIYEAGLAEAEIQIIWSPGEPGHAILSSASSERIDLLIAGALEKENIIRYYIGSVARKIMRDAECSVLILKAVSDGERKYRKFVVSTDFSEESEYAIRQTYKFALLENAEELIIIRDYRIPGLASAVLDSGNVNEVETAREVWQKEEEEKMEMFTRELNLKGIKITTHCLYGREGMRTRDFAKENGADIFAMNVPARRFRLIDRVFPREAEFIFEELPSNILIIREQTPEAENG